MPVAVKIPIRRLAQREFGEMSFEVMRHVMAIHNEIGRFFDESIYKNELSHRMPGVVLEEPIIVTFDSFEKRYRIDVLVGDGGIFEFKAVDLLTNRHRAQLLNYLLLCDSAHGKLINVRTPEVQHEFVNTHWTQIGRKHFVVDAIRWDANLPEVTRLQDLMIAMLRDVGTGLDMSFYEEAVAHFFNATGGAEKDVVVGISGREVGRQQFRLIAPGIAFKLTTFGGSLDPFEIHARRLLTHTDLRAIAWVNVNTKTVTFTTLQRSSG